MKDDFKKRLSVAFKSILCLAALLGVLIQCGVFSGNLRLSVLNYYTLQSNLLCLIYFSAAAVFSARRRDTLLPVFKGAVVMGITVTGLVYHIMLAGSFQMQGTMAISNLLLHYVVPVMSVSDWVLFDKKGRYTWRSPYLWVILPNAYFLHAVIRVALGANLGYGGNRYPYPFINIDALGWRSVMLNVVIMNLAFMLLGYAFVVIDHLLGRKTRKTE